MENLYDFLEVAKKFSDLGWSVQEQLMSLLDGEPIEEQNSNALRMIRDFLSAGFKDDGDATEIVERIDTYLAEDLPEYAI